MAQFNISSSQSWFCLKTWSQNFIQLTLLCKNRVIYIFTLLLTFLTCHYIKHYPAIRVECDLINFYHQQSHFYKISSRWFSALNSWRRCTSSNFIADKLYFGDRFRRRCKLQTANRLLLGGEKDRESRWQCTRRNSIKADASSGLLSRDKPAANRIGILSKRLHTPGLARWKYSDFSSRKIDNGNRQRWWHLFYRVAPPANACHHADVQRSDSMSNFITSFLVSIVIAPQLQSGLLFRFHFLYWLARGKYKSSGILLT